MPARTTLTRSPGAGPVLMVEDDPDIGQALAELLEDEGYDCILADNGIDALEILSRQTPSLLLVDLLMPVMNGVELIARVRRDARWSDIPIVVMTAAGENIFGRELESLNVSVLTKPVDLARLAEVLARHSRGSAEALNGP
jgi:CheY-like chemotaxis protein